jgi:hypothetical protein
MLDTMDRKEKGERRPGDSDVLEQLAASRAALDTGVPLDVVSAAGAELAELDPYERREVVREVAARCSRAVVDKDEHGTFYVQAEAAFSSDLSALLARLDEDAASGDVLVPAPQFMCPICEATELSCRYCSAEATGVERYDLGHHHVCDRHGGCA